MLLVVFFFKQKTAYEMRISDWSSDVCSSDLARGHRGAEVGGDQCFLDAVEIVVVEPRLAGQPGEILAEPFGGAAKAAEQPFAPALAGHAAMSFASIGAATMRSPSRAVRRTSSEEHTSELQSLMRRSYAVFYLKKKKHK